jgi:tetratricopeptide (TPR) repeat protein
MIRFFSVIVSLWFCATSLAQSPQKTFEKASESLKAGDYAAAEAGFLRVLKAEPNNLGALGNLGVVYSKTLRYAKAIEIYKQALRLNPRDQGILLNLGLVYLKQEDYQRARPYLQRLHRLEPQSVQATNLLATSLVYGGEPTAALELLKPLADSHVDLATLYLLGVAYSRAGQVEAGEAVFAKLLSDTATKAQTSFLLGQAYYDSARFDEAEQSFKSTLEADANFPDVHRELSAFAATRKPRKKFRRRFAVNLTTPPRCICLARYTWNPENTPRAFLTWSAN